MPRSFGLPTGEPVYRVTRTASALARIALSKGLLSTGPGVGQCVSGDQRCQRCQQGLPTAPGQGPIPV